MQQSARSRGRSALVLLATAGLAAGVLVTAPTAHAVEDVTTSRIAGDDRFETAAEIAEASYPDGATTAIVATAFEFPDALASAALAGGLDAPILLTNVDSIPAATTSALTELGVEDIIIAGGTAAVSNAVQERLEDDYTVIRLAGVDRYETAGAIAEAIGAEDVAELDSLRTAIVATGRNFPDALAGGTLAAEGAGTTGVHPILLTNEGVPTATEDAIEALDIEQVVILGGTGAVPTTVEVELEALTGNDAVRLAGTERHATAVAVAEAATEDFGFEATEVLLANSERFPDALAGGPLGALRGAPLLLTPATTLAGATRSYLVEHADVIEEITALGGTAAVSNATLAAAEDAAEEGQEPGANEALTVSPETAERLESDGTRTYTASGLGTTPVDIVLVDCARVNQGTTTSFENVNGNQIADGTADSADDDEDQSGTDAAITAVNGTDRDPDNPLINNDYVDGATPQNGTVTFEVSGPGGTSSSTCVVPVVFDDANQDDALNSSTANPAAPNEDFGTGGSVTFVPAAAPAGAFTNKNVETTDKSGNRFEACSIVQQSGTSEVVDPRSCASYAYDTNDVFRIGGAAVSMDEFERRLSPDDDVRGSYAADPAGTSTFDLTDEGPLPPGEPEASQDGEDVVVEFQESQTSTVDSYRLYRATAGGTAEAPTCAAFNAAGRSSYAVVGSADDPSTFPLPVETITIRDTSVLPATTYCYMVVAVDDGDESTGSGPATVTTSPPGTTTTTSTTVAPSNPTIIGAQGRDADGDGDVEEGDLHVLTFSEALAASSEDEGSYTVEDDSPIPTAMTFTCGENAICSLDGAVMTISIDATPSLPDFDQIGSDATLTYPLTITATEGFKDSDGNETGLGRATDTTIEGDTAEQRPYITAAEMTNDTAGFGNYGSLGDAMTLTFSEDVALVGDTTITEEEFEAITGRSVQYGAGTVVTATSATDDVLTLTIGGTTGFVSGINTGTVVDGSSNPYLVAMDDGAAQQANPIADPTLEPAS